ncbi:hypothetical protein HK100_004751 [Physocladia obscura]|uniref:Peptidase M20 dimerisation domain-containing protein n=1 Tax=Physocladia obscura TaxID=109957 RepID=A0AAD5T9T8_9FUNG|nr:hypothetical protein HK100_004751 [Physocladia obscura]
MSSTETTSLLGRKNGRSTVAKAVLAITLSVFALMVVKMLSETPGTVLPSCADPGTPNSPSTGFRNWTAHFSDPRFVTAAAERLGGAVRIATQTFESMNDVPPPLDVPDSPREGLANLRVFLQNSFPKTYVPYLNWCCPSSDKLSFPRHSTLKQTVISRYSLVYTWKGSDLSLKPLLFLAHLDTVPVLAETIENWTYPPFSGFIDFENDAIWGRGAVDTKSSLLGILEAVELLLGNGFIPKRTIYLVFGHDEEIGGIQGALSVAVYFRETLKLNGKIGMIIDEGLDSFSVVENSHINLAKVFITEHRPLTYNITVRTPGGHSSVPPPHSGIGIMSQLISSLESHPYQPRLSRSSIFLKTVICTNEYTPADKRDPIIANSLANFDDSKNAHRLAAHLSANSLADRYRMSTSQAVTIINGGLKVNTLPESVVAAVQYRVSVEDTFEQIAFNTWTQLLEVAQRLQVNLTVESFQGESIYRTYNVGNAVGNILVKLMIPSLPASSVAPTNDDVWKLLAGTIHHVYDSDETKHVVTPGLMLGNTDSRHFMDFSDHIYRFGNIYLGI